VLKLTADELVALENMSVQQQNGSEVAVEKEQQAGATIEARGAAREQEHRV